MNTFSKLKLKANGYTFTEAQIKDALLEASLEDVVGDMYEKFVTVLEMHAPPCPKCRGMGSVTYYDSYDQSQVLPCDLCR